MLQRHPLRITYGLMVINALLFGATFFWPEWVTRLLILDSQEIWLRPYMLVSHMFMHADIWHFLFNMLALWVFGSLIEPKIGWKRYLTFYLLAGILVGYLSSFFYAYGLGASGAINAVIGVAIILFPNVMMLVWFIPMPLWMAGFVFAAIDIFGINTPGSGVAHWGHLFGLVIGLLYGSFLIRQGASTRKRVLAKEELSADDIYDYLEKGRI